MAEELRGGYPVLSLARARQPRRVPRKGERLFGRKSVGGTQKGKASFAFSPTPARMAKLDEG
jgi:hypothetical protein